MTFCFFDGSCSLLLRHSCPERDKADDNMTIGNANTAKFINVYAEFHYMPNDIFVHIVISISDFLDYYR